MRAASLVVLLLLVGCGGATAPSSAASESSASVSPTPRPTPTPSGPLREIKVACMGPQTGALAFLGMPSLQACRMAVDDFNARTGGVDGVKVQVVAADDAGEADQAGTLARRLMADRSVLGVVGPMTGSAALAAAPAFDAAHVGFVSQSAAHPKLTESGWQTAHRLVARDDLKGPADAVFLFGPPVYAKYVYVVDRGDVDSISLADEFQKRAVALGMKVDRASATDNLPAVVAGAKAAKADVLFFAGQGSQCATALEEMRKQGAAFKLMSGAGCHHQERFIVSSQGAAEGMFVSDVEAGYDATPEGQAWAKDYVARFGAPPGLFSAYAYDAMRIILQAVENAASVRGGLDIRPADVNVEIDKPAGFKGLLGPITFDAKGDLQDAAVYIYQVAGGVFRQVKVVPAKG